MALSLTRGPMPAKSSTGTSLWVIPALRLPASISIGGAMAPPRTPGATVARSSSQCPVPPTMAPLTHPSLSLDITPMVLLRLMLPKLWVLVLVHLSPTTILTARWLWTAAPRNAAPPGWKVAIILQTRLLDYPSPGQLLPL